MKKLTIIFIIVFLFGLVSMTYAIEFNLKPTSSSTKTTATTSITYESIFTRNLSIGSSGKDVMALKKIIGLEFKKNIDTSPTFTSNTASDVKNLQEKYASEILTPNGLSIGTGSVGPSTRVVLNKFASKYAIKLSDFTIPTITEPENTYPENTEPENALKSYFTTYLKLGSIGDDVSLLKTVLNTDNDTALIPKNSTNIFDIPTEIALKKFQEKYASEILTPSGLTLGTGATGPSTRKKLNMVLNEILNPSQKIATSTTTSNNKTNITSTSTSITPAIIPETPPIPGKLDSFAPTIFFTSNIVKVNVGGAATLRWSTSNAVDQCKITVKDSSGSTFTNTVEISGTKSTGPIKLNTTYTIICYNKYGIPGTKNILIEVLDLSKIVIKGPTIISISPSITNRGATVKISGSGFLSTNNVIFDGIKIDNSLILSQSSSSISFIIPEYKQCLSAYCPAPTEDITVETGGKKNIQISNTNGFSNDMSITLNSKIIIIPKSSIITPYTPPKPSIGSISPISGNRGDIVTISGSGFSSDSVIIFDGFKVSNNYVISKNSSSISFKIPPYQMGCTDPEYEICPKLPIAGIGTIIETGGSKKLYVINTLSKSTSTSITFTLSSKKITY